MTNEKKTAVRAIVEATLAVIGDALSEGALLNLPPFGKAKVSRAGDAGSGKAMTVKLRRVLTSGPHATKDSGHSAKQAIADDDD